ncbi:MAG: tetratricopeptide repeat protein, partial [Candidatus Omnitrophota bacterium]
MDIVQYLTRARSALKEGEFDLAERYFKQVLQQFPHNEEALHGLKDLEVARTQKSSLFAKGFKFLRGTILKGIGQSDKAIDDLELLYRSQPDNVRAALAFAKCAEKTGRLEEAREAYEKVLSQNATHPQALEENAEILIRLERYDEAAALLQRLIVLKPKDDKIAHRLRDISAQAYSRVGIPENLMDRRAAIEKKKREAPGAPEFIEKLDNMLEEFRANPKDFQLGVDIAAHYRTAGLHNEANKILAAILDGYPSFEPARREQARVWRQSGEYGIAENLYQELLAASPYDQLLKDEYLDARIARFEMEIRSSAGGKDAAVQLERMKLDRDKNKIGLLKKILTEHPEADKERAELGELLIKHGRIEEAIPALQRLIREPSWAGRGYFLLGQSFRAKKDNGLAVEQYEKALEYFKNKGYSHIPSEELKAVYYYLGLTLEDMG